MIDDIGLGEALGQFILLFIIFNFIIFLGLHWLPKEKFSRTERSFLTMARLFCAMNLVGFSIMVIAGFLPLTFSYLRIWGVTWILLAVIIIFVWVVVKRFTKKD